MTGKTEIRCFFCGKQLGPLASRYLLTQQPRSNTKYIAFGYACEREAESKEPTIAELQAEVSKLKAEMQKAKAIGVLEFAAWIGPEDPFAPWDDLDIHACEKAQEFANLLLDGAV